MPATSNPVCQTTAETSPHTITPGLTLLFAVSVGVIVTNVFAPQTLVGMIAPSLGMPEAGTGLIAMATLLGYAGGLFLIVPLADLLENRALIATMLGGAAAAALAILLAPTATILLILLFILGACCSSVQVLVPIAASMAAPDRRGRIIGDVMSGVMIGILLSRPLASLLADLWGWRAFYGVSAIALGMLATFLAVRLPRLQPLARSSYTALIASLWHLLRDERALRQRALTSSLAMAAFSVFWTSVALRLAQPPFDLSQRGIALFALAGAGGAVATPLFGRFGDRGWTRPAIIITHLMVMLAVALASLAGSAATAIPWFALLVMAASAILLDFAVTGDQTLGRRVISLLRPEARSRLNGLFVGLFFIGGSIGSAVAGYVWTAGGWNAVCAVIALIGLAALVADWTHK